MIYHINIFLDVLIIIPNRYIYDDGDKNAYEFFLIRVSLDHLTILARLKSSVRFLYVMNMAQKKPTIL